MRLPSARTSEAAPGGPQAPGARRRWLMPGLFLGYVVLQLVFRVLVSDSAELDESEQLVLGQRLERGYGSQPPLYTWLQIGVFAVCGTNVFSLALLKSLLIFAILIFPYLAVREIGEAESMARLAAVSMFLIPQFAWEARRDLSHTVLAMAMVAATLFFAIRAGRRRRAGDYVALGVSAGLGLLGKYNYLLFLAALAVAAGSLKPFRAAVLDKKMLLGAASFLVVTWMHLDWLLANRDGVQASAGKLLVPGASSLVGAWAAGLGSLAVHTVLVVLALVLVYAVFLFRAPVIAAGTEATTQTRRLLQRTLLIGLLLCVGAVCCLQVRFKARWLLPLLMVAPMYLVLLTRPRLDAVRTKRILWAGGGAAVTALIALPVSSLVVSATGYYPRLNAPYAAWAAQLRQLKVAPGVIVAGNRLVGGNLRLFFVSSAVATPELVAPPTPVDVEWLVIWDATTKPEIPASLMEFTARLRRGNFAPTEPRYVESFAKYSRQKVMKLGFVVLPAVP